MTSPKINRCVSCRKIFSDESEFNKIRAKILVEDKIAGKNTIIIGNEVYHKLVELSRSMKNIGNTYDELIKLSIDSYVRDQENNGNDRLEGIVSDNETEE